MKTDTLNKIIKPDIQNQDGFEQKRGFFIINHEPVMTDNQILTIEQEYDLIEFGSGGRIDLRRVIFWYASLKQGILRIICYDNQNKVVISKMYDDKNAEYCDWFLLPVDFWEGEVLEFQF